MATSVSEANNVLEDESLAEEARIIIVSLLYQMLAKYTALDELIKYRASFIETSP